jgi:ubiquinone/menaquinone biosynthesis C-methylase UbiE
VSRQDAAREAQRIRAVYARRAQNGIERRYSPFEPAHLFQTQSLERDLLRALRDEGCRTLEGRRILDVGCGGGVWLAGLTRYGARPADLIGVDLREEILHQQAGQIHLLAAAADCLPFAAASFDIVAQVTMMSSVLDQHMRARIAVEMRRVLRPAGILLWYDFTVNPFNRDVAGVKDRELRRLFPDAVVGIRRATLAPPLTRLIAPHAWLACEALERIPWLRTHILATIRFPAQASAVAPANSD